MLRLALAFVLAITVAAPAAAGKHKGKAKAARPAPSKLLTSKKARPAPRNAVERLAQGAELYKAGDYAAARRMLLPLEHEPLLARDYMLYMLAQSELLDGVPAAAEPHFRALEKLGGRFTSLARYRAADALYAAGKLAPAGDAYAQALRSSPPEIDAAVAQFRVAEIKQSAAQYRRVYLEHPTHPLADPAFEALTRLAPDQPITAAERVGRAKLLTAGRAWPRALEELALIGDAVAQPLRDEADYWIGMTRFRMRREYLVAAQKLLGVWERLPGDERRADALFHGARAQSRADHDDEAQVGYREVVRRFPHARQAAEASFLIGWLDFNRGKYKEAIPELDDTLKHYGKSQFEDDARWCLGFSRWLAGDTAGALRDFEKLAAHSGALTGGKGAYWRGRALEQLGRKDEAKTVWRGIVAEFPLSYYAQVARLRLRALGVELAPFAGVDPARAKSPPPLATTPPELGTDGVVARVDELYAAGLSGEAAWELRSAEGDLFRRLGAAKALPLLFDRYARGADFYRSHMLAEAHSGAALRLDPQENAQVRAWWEQVYPLAYRPFVEKYAPIGANPPYYLYTIMLKESAYNPSDVSYADAIGLLQMIPPTSRKVALRIDTPYTDDVLYDPEGNIHFGAWYIGHLLAKFKGQIALGAGSYNAGPTAMKKWLKQHGDRPLDEFIELCPYTQTREYMKKALEIYARYVYLYAKEDYLPDLHVDPVPVEDDGIDY